MAANSLVNRRVLVTRPEGRADELMAALTAEGAFCRHLPLLDIEPLEEGEEALLECRQRIADLDHYQSLIFISVNAVEHGLREIDRLWPQWPKGVTAFAIGAATQAALCKSDFPVAVGLSLAEPEAGAAMDSEALLARTEFHQVEHQKMLIFRGLGGREKLADELRARGARVDYAQCYRRRESAVTASELHAALAENRINTVCLNSGETLLAFSQRLGNSSLKNGLQIVVPSERVAELARKEDFKHIVVSANAGTAATVSALQT
ncbi:uroporphyrinogen-III synthase [Spongiibacter sp. KMU-158]|uniref:Uroporphyrinogen-III synthase n=1 Tax=Spongiibacter pelagi TaxID=2760804 RepID=A0A927GV91_9GAMM|nr:uroporphyrinogen-III synthase [Spongiibacter pelagi]MBD2857823.1 uroporphyrinogen-III synthase [Spongiibacter pelagi]